MSLKRCPWCPTQKEIQTTTTGVAVRRERENRGYGRRTGYGLHAETSTVLWWTETSSSSLGMSSDVSGE